KGYHRNESFIEGDEGIFISLAASRCLNDSLQGEDDVFDRSYITKTTSETLKDFRLDMKLTVDHENHPLWVTTGGHIFLESFSSAYKQVHVYIITVADPISRSEYIQEHKLS
ncbi:unnamed protein product, partial [Rotaria sp. Silwood1]